MTVARSSTDESIDGDLTDPPRDVVEYNEQDVAGEERVDEEPSAVATPEEQVTEVFAALQEAADDYGLACLGSDVRAARLTGSAVRMCA